MTTMNKVPIWVYISILLTALASGYSLNKRYQAESLNKRVGLVAEAVVDLAIENPAEAERRFNALAEGGTVRMPFGKTFFSNGFGMCVDKFGIPWMVNCPKEDM